jgi:hypothetical protein
VLVATARIAAQLALRGKIEEQRARRDVVLADLPAVGIERRMRDAIDRDEHLEVLEIERATERLLGDVRATVLGGAVGQRLAPLGHFAEPLRVSLGLRGGCIDVAREHVRLEQRFEQLADLVPRVRLGVRPRHRILGAKLLDLEQLLADRRDVGLVEDQLGLAVEHVQDLLSVLGLEPGVRHPLALGDVEDLVLLELCHDLTVPEAW